MSSIGDANGDDSDDDIAGCFDIQIGPLEYCRQNTDRFLFNWLCVPRSPATAENYGRSSIDAVYLSRKQVYRPAKGGRSKRSMRKRVFLLLTMVLIILFWMALFFAFSLVTFCCLVMNILLPLELPLHAAAGLCDCQHHSVSFCFSYFPH